jgi:hypothetical protein
MLQNGWHSEIKLLASANAVSDRDGEDNEARMPGRVLRADPRMPSPVRCQARTTVLSTPVDNYVDSLFPFHSCLDGPSHHLESGGICR